MKNQAKICLVAVNSKYIHTNPAVYSLRAYAEEQGIPCSAPEFSINQPLEEILAGIMEEAADLYAFSVYIWNCETIFHLTENLKKLKPEAEIWCGGPEVSYHAKKCLKDHPQLRGILRGEGEESFAAVAKAYLSQSLDRQSSNTVLSAALQKIDGLTFRTSSGEIIETADRAPVDLKNLIFPYGKDRQPDPDRIVYYESSRGCPYSCTYCLSCLEKKLRFKPLPMVITELEYFLNQRVKQVKFVDRTFNANEAHAMAIWQYLKEHDNGITNFHFEICAELLSDDAIALLNSLRPGQVQLEIGVQTTNPETLTAIQRTRDADKLTSAVSRLLDPGNVHVHLDLIAGLPFEGMPEFIRSFNEVFLMKPHQLQLGFLKLLKGTPMERFAAENAFLADSRPPYEVLATPWISYDELRELKRVEAVVETYYNSHQFEKTLAQLQEEFSSPFGMFAELAAFLHKNGHDKKDHGRMERYELLLDFIRFRGLDAEAYVPLLLFDFCARERLKHWPKWAGNCEKPVCFDYEHKDPVTGNAVLYGLFS